MNPASVGFQCPDCIRKGRASVRSPRTVFGGALSPRGGIVTKVLIGIMIGTYLLDLFTGHLLTGMFAMSNLAVSNGQFWRLISYGFLTYGLLNTAMIAFVLWLVGRPLEHYLGGWRFLVLYLLSGFGGATLLYVFGSPALVGVGGASAAVIGLLAANGVIKYRHGDDIRGDIGLLVILVLLNFVIGFQSLAWVAQVGGILVGGLTGVALVYAPRARRSQVQVAALIMIVAVCVIAVAGKTMINYGVI
ncbi:rhomboid family intramembrane serine protease [Microlunatus elymi]|uniref:Rhomboid family intramembrane serine protease n=2 Tax=Microlunatus elymi TaxID=2596828 RepID=A0A516Q351_9ACTN|nr:rhomboid family intramembrane serine protease [Microlunatus elymi]